LPACPRESASPNSAGRTRTVESYRRNRAERYLQSPNTGRDQLEESAACRPAEVAATVAQLLSVPAPKRECRRGESAAGDNRWQSYSTAAAIASNSHRLPNRLNVPRECRDMHRYSSAGCGWIWFRGSSGSGGGPLGAGKMAAAGGPLIGFLRASFQPNPPPSTTLPHPKASGRDESIDWTLIQIVDYPIDRAFSLSYPPFEAGFGEAPSVTRFPASRERESTRQE
jgi:hypothetical protein